MTQPQMPTRALVPHGTAFTQPFTPEATASTPLTQEMYEKLRLAVAQAYPRQARRNLLLLRTLRATGLRISEVLRLERRHVQQEGPSWYLWITRSKKQGALPEKVYIAPLLGIELAGYAQGLDIGLTDSLFQGAKSRVAMSRRMVETVFAKASLSLDTKVWPHRVRRLYYSWLRDQGLPSRAAAAMIGDSEAVAERHYLEDLPDDRKRAIAERIPE